MKTIKKLVVLIACTTWCLVFGLGSAFGAGYPDKPITLIVHADAGGGGDLFARTFASAADKYKLLPQPVIVENKPGGSGGVAYAYVAGKKSNPYFIVTSVTNIMTTPLMGLTPVGLQNFTPIANLAFDEYMFIVNANSKFKSMKDLVAEARKSPKTVTVGGSSFGGSDSICAYLIEKAEGVQFNYITFNSGSQAVAALLGNHVIAASANPGEALELAKAGKVRILGILSDKRFAGAPEVPTMKEQSINALYNMHRGICAPAGIPEEARKVLEEALFKYTKTDIYKEYIKTNGLTEAWMDGRTFGKWLENENKMYTKILGDMGLLKK